MTERIVVLVISVGLCVSIAQGAITATGDVDPANPATWTSSTAAKIGDTGTGSVTVDNCSDGISGWGRPRHCIVHDQY